MAGLHLRLVLPAAEAFGEMAAMAAVAALALARTQSAELMAEVEPLAEQECAEPARPLVPVRLGIQEASTAKELVVGVFVQQA